MGKTFVGSEKLYQLGARVNLVICQKSKINDWIKHFEGHYYPDVFAYDCTRWKKNDWQALVKDPEFKWDSMKKWKHHVLVINYELAWRRKELLQLHDFTLMLDESSLIQNRKAKQSKFILKLNFKNVILLSGTPCSGKYENLWTQAHLLGWQISEELYQQQYINWKLIQVGYGYKAQFHKIVDKDNPYKNVERLKRKLREYGADFLKTEECFDLPEQTFIDVRVPVSNEYKRFIKDSVVAVDKTMLVGSSTLTKRLYLRMLCGIYSDAKLEAFKELLESTNDRVIVFYSFTDELEKLMSVAHQLQRLFSVVNGQRHDLTFYEDDDSSITFVQYQAGAKGLNLQKANKIIFYSPTERCEDYMQALKRIHRIGQENHCFYYRMMCEGSIEERIYHALERGADYTDQLFKEDYGC